MNEYVLHYSPKDNKYIFNSKNYKKHLYKKNNFHFSIIFLLIIILVGICVFLKPKSNKLLEFYFIEINNFQTYNRALELSNEINSSGGAGYVYFDGSYHVLANFYSNYEDAEAVLNNIKNTYPNSSILTINAKQFSYHSDLSNNQNSAIKNLLDNCNKTTLEIEQILIEFDRGKISSNNLQIKLKNISENFNSSCDNFISHFKSNSKFNLAKEYAKRLRESISNMVKNDGQNLSSKIRYNLVSFVICQHQFLSCF